MTESGVALRSGWGAVLVRGPDAWSFLQDLVSQDLDGIVDGAGAHSLLLSPQGKLVSDFRLLRSGEDAWLDAVDGPGLAAALARFKLRVDVEISDRSDDRAMASVRGEDAIAVLGIDVPTAQHSYVEVGTLRAVRADWPGIAGVDLLGPRDAVQVRLADLEADGVANLDDATFDRLRIDAGIPLQGADIDDRTIPQEAFLERDAVSFDKGCFLGQELVCRIDTRGRVTRYLRRVEIPGVVPDRGTELRNLDGKVMGTLTSVAPRPRGGAVALAMVRHDVHPPAELTLADGSERSVQVLEVPERV